MGRNVASLLSATVLLVVLPFVSGPLYADDADAPAWLVPGVTYAGVWKTLGANRAPDLDSQITLGHTGPDGNMVLLTEDGKLAIVYGVYPLGAPNHTDVMVLATRTPDGFKFGEYPARPEFTCTFGSDGSTLTCDRHALAQGREFFNHVEMARLSPEASVPPPTQPVAAAPASFTPSGGDACFMQDRFAPVSQNGQRFRDQFVPPGDGVAPEHAAFVGAWSGRSPDNGEEFRLVVFRVGAPDSRVAFVGSTFQSQGFWTPDLPQAGVMRFESSFGNINTFRMLEDGEAVELTRGAPGQSTLHATLTRCSLD
jgi:hypothetical protein